MRTAAGSSCHMAVRSEVRCHVDVTIPGEEPSWGEKSRDRTKAVCFVWDWKCVGDMMTCSLACAFPSIRQAVAGNNARCIALART